MYFSRFTVTTSKLISQFSTFPSNPAIPSLIPLFVFKAGISLVLGQDRTQKCAEFPKISILQQHLIASKEDDLRKHVFTQTSMCEVFKLDLVILA